VQHDSVEGHNLLLELSGQVLLDSLAVVFGHVLLLVVLDLFELLVPDFVLVLDFIVIRTEWDAAQVVNHFLQLFDAFVYVFDLLFFIRVEQKDIFVKFEDEIYYFVVQILVFLSILLDFLKRFLQIWIHHYFLQIQ